MDASSDFATPRSRQIRPASPSPKRNGNLGVAADFQDADGLAVFDYWQAQERARAIARSTNAAANDARPLTVAEAKVVIEQWRKYSNTVRPHSSLGYRPPAPEVISWPTSPDSVTIARSAVPPLVETPPLN